MTDKEKQHDEYEFSEYDSFGEDLTEEKTFDEEEAPRTDEGGSPPPKKNVPRNALIVIAAIVGSLLIYQFLSYLLKKPAVKPAPKPAPAITSTIKPVTEPVKPLVDTEMIELKQRVQLLEEGQDKIKTDEASLKQDVEELKTRVDQLVSQMTVVSQNVENMSSQFAKQAEEINALLRQLEALKPKKPVVHVHVIRAPRLVYFIQAVIPGRAWLIATNGSTLTVREGSKITGYGVVQLIDSIQGRVLTSSGRVIRFSQDDS
jgi:intracellular multiplication protein IcmG